MTGTEEISLEVGGHIDAERAALLAGPGLTVVERRGRVAVGLLILRMRDLGPLRLGYGEALWRLAVSHEGRPAWLGVACDLDRPLVRWLAAPLIRYPVRAARIDLRGSGTEVVGEVEARAGRLRLCGQVTQAQPPAEPPRPLLVRQRGRLFSVPWDEVPAVERRVVLCQAEDLDLARATLGIEVALDRAGLLHRGRGHRCGLARALR